MDSMNLTIQDIDKGFLIEQVNLHLAEIIADILNPNKQATKKRSVNIQITLAPSKSRRDAQLTYKVEAKPATHIERESQTIFIARDKDGNAIAKPYSLTQGELPGVQEAIDADADALATNGSN